MLLNPCRDDLPVYPGTRLIHADLGVLGAEVIDPINPQRMWTVMAAYAPAPRRLSGLRFKLVDQKEFVTFCNQRDFEVLLGLAKPGDWCQWAGHHYVEPDDREWFGLCMDKTDLEDDLFDREMFLRAQYGGRLPNDAQIYRRVHPEPERDAEDSWLLLRDYDLVTGIGPDTRLETIDQRWVVVARDWLRWERV